MRTAIGVAVLLAAAAVAQTPPAKARIEGRLENALTGEPLRKGILRLRIATSTYRGPQYVTESDASGNFTFEQVEPGSYVLSGDRAGYLKSNYGVHFLPNGEPIRLRAGEKKLLRLALTPRSAISGRVLNQDGDPLPNLEVAAWRWRWSPSAAERMLQLVARVTPDEDGNFRLNTLAAGQYYLSASSLTQTSLIQTSLTQTSLTQTRVADSPIPILRRGIPQDRLTEGYQTTFFPGVLTVDQAKMIDLAAGQEAAGLSLRIQRSKLSRVRGTVANHYSFLPLNMMTVQLVPLDAPAVVAPSQVRSVNVEDGEFEFSRIAPGRYSIVAKDNSPAQHLTARADVLVAGRDVDDVRMELRPGADIKCVVRADRLRNAVHDQPAGVWQSGPVRATIMLRSLDGGASDTIVATQDRPDGPLQLRDIPPGRYWVDVTNLGNQFYVKWIRFGEQDVTAAPLKVGKNLGGSELQLEVMLSDKTATLSGTAMGPGGAPVRIAQVILAPASPELERVPRLVKGAIVGPDGTFHFDGITPGQYTVLAFEDAEPGLAEDPEFRSKYAARGTTIDLGPSGDQTIEVQTIEIQAASSAK